MTRVLFSAAMFSIPVLVFAQDSAFIPLSPNIPILGTNWYTAGGGIKGFLNVLLFGSVIVAAILAVVMVAIGGFKWMTTDSVFAIGGAKEQIADAIIGLLIVLAAVLILTEINPKIVDLSIFNPPPDPTITGGANTIP